MSTRKFKVGLIGTGGIARSAHLPAWKSLPEVEIVGVADVALARGFFNEGSFLAGIENLPEVVAMRTIRGLNLGNERIGKMPLDSNGLRFERTQAAGEETDQMPRCVPWLARKDDDSRQLLEYSHAVEGMED